MTPRVLTSHLWMIWCQREANPRGKCQAKGIKQSPMAKTTTSKENSASHFNDPRVLASRNKAYFTMKVFHTSLLAFIHHIGNKNSAKLKHSLVKWTIENSFIKQRNTKSQHSNLRHQINLMRTQTITIEINY